MSAGLFTPVAPRQAHSRLSPSLTLERGETHIRAPRPRLVKGKSSFYTNNDTGIDTDGILKSGYASGELCELSPSPTPSPDVSKGFEIFQSSSRSPILTSFPMQRRSHSRQSSLSFQPNEDIVLQREAARRKRMRKAGSTGSCGAIPVLLGIMTICSVVILFAWVKIREHR